MADDASWIKGYESSTPEEATTPFMPDEDVYLAVGQLAKEFKAQWRGRATLTNDQGRLK